MNFSIQDDIIRRALDFFGLRGIVQHEYEATVLPIVNIGNLGQKMTSVTPLITALAAGLNTIWGPPPAQKTWRLLTASGRITQTVGAAPVVMSISLTGFTPGQGILIPFYAAPSGAVGVQPQIRQAFALNTVNDFTLIFPIETFIPPNGTLNFVLATGDGTITLSAAVLTVQELGENLVETR